VFLCIFIRTDFGKDLFFRRYVGANQLEMQTLMKKRITAVFGVIFLILAILYYLSPDWIAKFGLSIERLHAGLTRHSIRVEKIDYAYLTGGAGVTSGSAPRANCC
jgi:hypothetical protein